MEKRVLGKGLSALISDRVSFLREEETSAGGHKERIKFIELGRISTSNYQPRKHFDQESLTELMDSIKEKGVIQPILVRKREGEGYEIIAGERRFRAVSQLGFKKIPVIEKQVDDKEALELSLIENIQREQLNPVDEANAYAHLIEKFSFTQEEVANAVGKERSTITNLLRILKLPVEIQEALKEGKISTGHARALLGLKDVKEQMLLCKKIIERDLSVREVERYVYQDRDRTKRGTKREKQADADILRLENELSHILGTKIRIRDYKGKGRIEIEYYSFDGLMRILQFLRRV